MTGDNYPTWVCQACGCKYGRMLNMGMHMSTWHNGTCDICGNQAAVTEPRDFGHLKPEWVNERKERCNGS